MSMKSEIENPLDWILLMVRKGASWNFMKNKNQKAHKKISKVKFTVTECIRSCAIDRY